MNNEINFHSESIDFVLSNQEVIIDWVRLAVEQEQNTFDVINFIFCSDEYLHQINIDYLQHDNYTDIITFPYNTNPVEGDIFISIDRVKENALKYEVAFEKELHRVIIHGVLHLLGYLDKSKLEKQQMTQKENYYLNLIS